MICFKCDRCGETFDWYEVGGFNGVAKIKTERDGANLTAGGEINLCPNCMKTLNDWMSGDAYILTKSEEEERLKNALIVTAAEVLPMMEDGATYTKVGESEDGDIYAEV